MYILNSKKSHILLAVLGFFLVAVLLRRCPAGNEPAPYQKVEGTVFHTIYHITYQSDRDFREDFDRLFREFDGSLSMFNDTSVISRMNRNDPSVLADRYFTTVFHKAKAVSEATGGAFDITVAPLVNLWGFGFKNSDSVSQQAVDSILQFVGWESVALREDGRLLKQDERTILDASSIAKGYMSDVVAEFLRENGVENYMVEIGGEIALNGVNPNGAPWGIGINKPTDDPTSSLSELLDVLYLSGGGVATSGNYRNFYVKDGQKFAHTIDPHSGYPIQQDILSSTVIAADCMTADAFATAFMVLGKEKSLQILERDPSLMAYFIVSSPSDSLSHNPSDSLAVIFSPALAEHLKNGANVKKP